MSSNEKPSELRILRDALMDTILAYDLDADENLYMLPVEQFDKIVAHLAQAITTKEPAMTHSGHTPGRPGHPDTGEPHEYCAVCGTGLSNQDIHDGRDTCQWCRLDPPKEQDDEQHQ